MKFKRYFHRFMLEFFRIATLLGVKRTICNQYDSLVRPLQIWLGTKGVQCRTGCKVTVLHHKIDRGKFAKTSIQCKCGGKIEVIAVSDDDFVRLQNGFKTDASSLSWMTSAPRKLMKTDSDG